MTTSARNGRDCTISVVLVSPQSPPIGGHTVWTAEYLAAAPHEGVAVTLVDTSPGGAQVNARSRVRVARVRQMATTLRHVRRASTPGAVAHITTTWYWALVRDGSCAWIARRRGASVLLHVHASTNVTASLAASSPAMRWVLRRWLWPVHTIAALTEELAAQLRSVVPRTSVVVVPNWVDTEAFRPRSSGDRSTIEGEGRCRVLFVGRLMAEKGFLELANAVCRDERLLLVTIGDRATGADDERARVDAALAALSSSGRHVHHPIVGRADIADHYRSADVFALPSWNEGLPISLLEAMATGLPCVVTAVGGMGDLIRRNPGTKFAIEVPVADADALAATLGSLAQDPGLRSSLGQAGRAIVEADNSRAAVFRDFRAAYAGALGRPYADPPG